MDLGGNSSRTYKKTNDKKTTPKKGLLRSMKEKSESLLEI